MLALALLARTNWGQSKPLRKCIVLSVLAHVLLAGYATTVQIVAASLASEEEPSVKVTSVEGLAAEPHDRRTIAKVVQPWDETAGEPSSRAEPGGAPATGH